MPKGGAAQAGAKIIAREKRKNDEGRKVKVKTEGDTYANENEVLKMREKRKKSKRKNADVQLSSKMQALI